MKRTDDLVLDGDTILREGLKLDEREHHPLPDPRPVKLPWLRNGGPAPKAPPVAEQAGEPNTAMRDFLAEELDVGLVVNEVKFRKRHNLDADVELTPQAVEAAIKRRADEQRRAAVDPFDFDR